MMKSLMTNLFYKIARFIGNFCVDTYLHKFPFFIIYKPQFHKVKGYMIRDILHKVRTADILIRRHDGYISSIFIPGFWTHVGIYVGQNEVIHIIETGVKKEDILDFCRTDHIALLRVKVNCDRYEVIKRAYIYYQQSQKGELAYDFLFKSNNKNLYCTELVNNCFQGIFDNDFWQGKYLRPDDIFNSHKVDRIVIYRNE